jgi:ribosomal protein S18 acetylase RimI-like enzyme
VFADDAQRIRIVEEAGFESQADVGEDSWSKVLLVRPAEPALPAWTAPEGFTIRPLRGSEEAQQYVFLHRAVFGSPNMTREWRLRTLRQLAYQPDLDLVVVDPQGQMAAFCICWLDRDCAAGVTGQIEPLGVREAYRGQGLGQAILAEGLRRLSWAGAQRILVETDLYRGPALSLYESAGFQVEREVLVFRKEFPSQG